MSIDLPIDYGKSGLGAAFVTIHNVHWQVESHSHDLWNIGGAGARTDG
jgi:hypothetical protein